MIEIDVSNGFELGCFHYQVKSDQDANGILQSNMKFGEHSGTLRLIRVSTDFGADQFHNTFLHEVIEGVIDIYCNNKIKHDELTNLANGLSQVLKSMGVIFVAGKKNEDTEIN